MGTYDRRTVLSLLAAAPLGAAGPGLGERLAAAARRQLGVTRDYDASYRRIAYPNGDVLRSSGVCADVVVRAARDAWGVDLQRLIHEDMRRAFDAYPSRRAWGLAAPDPNIDHRRVLNLETYWTRRGALIERAPPKAWGDGFAQPCLAGDILTWRLNGKQPHMGVVVAGPRGVRLVHNIGSGVQEQPLWMFKLHKPVAHYRWAPGQP